VRQGQPAKPASERASNELIITLNYLNHKQDKVKVL